MRIHLKWRVYLLLVAIGLCIVIASCGRGHRRYASTSIPLSQSNINEITPSYPESNPQTKFKPFPSLPDGNYPKSKVSQVSSSDYYVMGFEKIAYSGSLNRINPIDGQSYVVIADKDNPLSFAQYNVIDLFEFRPVQISFKVQTYKMDDEDETLPMHFYIGLANYSKAIWEWKGPYTNDDPNEFSISINNPENRNRYVDRNGTLHFVLISTIQNSPKLSKRGRVGVSLEYGKVTLDSDYLPNMPYYPQIKNIYTGLKPAAAISSLKEVSLQKNNSSSINYNNQLFSYRTSSQVTEDQYVTIEWDHVYAFNAPDTINEAKNCVIYRKGPYDLNYKRIGEKLSKIGCFVDPIDVNILDGPIFPPEPGGKYWYKIAFSSSTLEETQKSEGKYIIEKILPPNNVKASVGKEGFINLTWEPSIFAELYEVWSSSTVADPDIKRIATIQAPKDSQSVVSFIDSLAETNTIKYYRVKALSKEKAEKEGVSDFSAEVIGLNGDFLYPPTEVSASDGTVEKQIIITWKPPIEGTIPEGYSIWRSETEKGDFKQVGFVINDLDFSDTPPTPDTYWYKVKSIKSKVVDSEFCANSVKGIIKKDLLPPVNVSASKGSYISYIYVSWTLPPATSQTPNNYTVWRSSNSKSDYSVIANNVTSKELYDSTAIGDTTYWYKIQSNVSGQESSGLSSEVYGFKHGLECPFSVTATVDNYADRIRIEWTYGFWGLIPDGFMIYRSTDPVNDFQLIDVVSNQFTTFDDYSVLAETTYYYKIVSYKADYNNSSFSGVVSGKRAISIPPNIIFATNGIYQDKIRITWDHPNGSQDKGFKIYRASSAYDNPYELLTTVGTVTQFDDTSVKRNTFYWYKISALSVKNTESSLSNVTRGSLELTPNIWSMNGREPTHNCRSPFIGSRTNNLQWKFETSYYTNSSPVIDTEGTIYFCENGNYLYALNPDRSQKWSFYGNCSNTSPAISVDGTIYIGSLNNQLIAINPNGTQKWVSSVGYWISGSPIIGADGTIYVTGGYSLIAIDPNGTQKWVFTSSNYIYSSPAIGIDGTIYFGNVDGNLYALNSDGTAKWCNSTIKNRIETTPAIGAEGTIYLGSYDDYLYAINPDGTSKWSYYAGSTIRSSPAIGLDGTIYFGCDAGLLYAINPDGSLNWSYTASSALQASPVIGADGVIYIVGTYGVLYALSPNGKLLWDYDTVDYAYSSPVIGPNGSIYLYSYFCKLYAFEPGSGKSGLEPPENINASNGSVPNKITISWDPPSSGPVPDGYYIYHALSDKGVWLYVGQSTSTSFDDFYTEPGKIYYYKVQSYKSASGYNDSFDSIIDTGSRK